MPLHKRRGFLIRLPRTAPLVQQQAEISERNRLPDPVQQPAQVAQRIPAPEPLRRNPFVIAAGLTATATLAVGVYTGIVTIVTHPPTNPAGTSNSQSQTSCPTVAEDYYTKIHRNPGIVRALVDIVRIDPDARRCGITPIIIEIMSQS
jgi:hypothetical protein